MVVGFTLTATSSNYATQWRGHVWGDDEQKWLLNAFEIKGCHSNLCVRTSPEGNTSLLFVDSEGRLVELHSKKYHPRIYDVLPQIVWKSACNSAIHVHYYATYDLAFIFCQDGMIKYNFRDSTSGIGQNAPSMSDLIVKKTASFDTPGPDQHQILCFAVDEGEAMGDPNFVMLRYNVDTDEWQPTYSDPVHIPDSWNVIENNNKLYYVDTSSKIIRKPRKAQSSSFQDMKRPKFPKFIGEQSGVDIVAGRYEIYTVFQDLLIPTSVDTPDNVDTLVLPKEALSKNPLYVEREKGLGRPSDVHTFMELPLGLCRSFNVENWTSSFKGMVYCNKCKAHKCRHDV